MRANVHLMNAPPRNEPKQSAEMEKKSTQVKEMKNGKITWGEFKAGTKIK